MSAPTGTSHNRASLGPDEKIQGRHLERLAVVYVRQSTVQQVLRHQESTKLQYSLKDVAERLGWPRERVLVIDEDLGMSGATSEARTGFQRLLSEVALNHVGIILGVEISRLARSCKDWHQLLELCSLFGTLIRDLDGLYDPASYNDRLLLGLKGTMSEAELHIIKQRMLQGKLQKARRGELGMRLPIGYARRFSGEVVLDPDEQVQTTVRLVFGQFERLGTIDAVLRYLVEHGVQLGVRLHGREDAGDLEWRRPSRPTLANMLKSPTYAGAYVYGRRAIDPRRKRPGRPGTGRTVAPPDKWAVCLRDRLPAYVSWAQYERNLAQLATNRSRVAAQGAIRKGSALLQGLLVCGRCGARMNTQYGGKASYPRYSCLLERTQYGGKRCQGLAARTLDAEVSRLVLAALQPAALEVSLRVSEDLERQRGELETQWTQKLERARYEADRAARQYRAVEPENRLVARNLERAWEEKLKAQRTLEEEHERSRHVVPRGLQADERAAIQSLADDLPKLWNASSTTAADRKAIMRQVIDRIVVTVEGETEWVEATIHWAGGQRTYTRLRRPVARLEQLSTHRDLVARIRGLKGQGLTSPQIAEQLNSEGWRPAKRRETFNREMVRTLTSRDGLTQVHRRRGDLPALGADEHWLPDLAKHLAMPEVTLYNWLTRGWVKGRQLGGAQGRWVVLADDAERKRLAALRTRRRSWAGPADHAPPAAPGPSAPGPDSPRPAAPRRSRAAR